jgi:DNA-binding HxlR family transcriptional regulator
VSAYADYCPIASAVEVLGDRWTPLVIRELMIGATGFNEIHRGVPKMSRSLLSDRLRNLERRGLVVRESSGRGNAVRYELTPAGEGLVPIVWAMGHWAAEWAFGDPTDDELDGLSLLWRLHQHAVPDRVPDNRTVVHIVLTGHGEAEGWLDIEGGDMTVCRTDPGREVDLVVQAVNRQMHRWLLGLVPFPSLVSCGDVRLLGPGRLTRAFPTWFDTSFFTVGLQRAQERRAREAALVSDRQQAVG